MAWCVAGVPILSEGEPWPGVLLGSLFLVKESCGLVCCCLVKESCGLVCSCLVKESRGLVCCWGPYS